MGPIARGRFYRNALIFTALMLLCMGLLMIFTSSSVTGELKFKDSLYFVKKQAMFGTLGLMIIVALQWIPFSFIEKVTLPLMALTIILFGITLIPGLQHTAKGASRWISLGFFTFQPSEFGKIAWVLFLAKSLSRPGTRIDKDPKAIIPNLLVLAVMGALLMMQPDFGSTVIYTAICFVMLFVAGLPIPYLAVSGMIGAMGAVGMIMYAPYRMARIFGFLDPWKNIATTGFQIAQSLLAFHNGGILGAGLGESRQKLGFLPEAHTDFILSVIGEEAGLIGVFLVILCFAYLAWLGMKITALQTESYKKYLALGLSSFISIQAIVNMGVAMGLAPTKGMSLPFVSFGSSSLLIFMLMIGLLAKLAVSSDSTHGKSSSPSI